VAASFTLSQFSASSASTAMTVPMAATAIPMGEVSQLTAAPNSFTAADAALNTVFPRLMAPWTNFHAATKEPSTTTTLCTSV
jgi:hypothetical protein